MTKNKDPRFGTIKNLTIISNIMMHNSNYELTQAYLKKDPKLIDKALTWVSRAFQVRKKRAQLKSELVQEGLMNITKRDMLKEVPEH